MSKKLYQCEECKLHYKDKQLADDCHKFCVENNACNIEITKHSVESKNHDAKLESKSE